MKAKVVFPFFDISEKVNRKLGDEFECSAERFAAINSTGYGELAVAAKEEAPAVEAEEKPKPKSKKKAEAK